MALHRHLREKGHSKTSVRKLWIWEDGGCEEHFQGVIGNSGDRKALCCISPLWFSLHCVCPPKY